MADHETFTARWNRRKLEAKSTEQAKQAEIAEQAAAAARLAELELVGANTGDAEPVDETPLPTLDDVTPEGDVVAFLHKRVPAELQKLALRKAWTSDPVISKFIEVAENQYDWNALDGVPGFGPMDPSWNVQELLAQAIGAVPAEAKDQVVVAQVGESGAPVDENRDRTTQGLAADCDSSADISLSASQQSRELNERASNADQSAGMPDAVVDVPLQAERVQSTSDVPAQAQLLALHNFRADRQRRHGRALPEG